MSLSPGQIEALERGEPVFLIIDHTECIVLRKDIFERVQRAIGDEWTDDELRTVAAQTVEDADTAGPIE